MADFKNITGHSNDEAFGHNMFMAENDMYSAGDPRLQELIDAGYVKHVGGGGGDGGDNGHWVSTEKAPALKSFFTMAPTNPDGGGAGGSGMLNQRDVWFDPFYGNVTSVNNIAPAKTTALDVVGPMAAGALAGGIGLAGGLGAGAGGVGGLAGASQVGQAAAMANIVPGLAQSAGSDGGFSPWGLAGAAAGAFSPWAGKAVTLAGILRQRMNSGS